MNIMPRSEDTPILPLISHPREQRNGGSKYHACILIIGIIGGYMISGTYFYFGLQKKQIRNSGGYFLAGGLVGSATTAALCRICYNVFCRD